MPKTKAKAKTKAASTTKRPAAKKRANKASSKSLVSRMRIERTTEDRPFFEFRVTEQTLYWLILGVVSIAFAIWIFTLDAKVRKLYDEIDANTYATSQYNMKDFKKKNQQSKEATSAESQAETEAAEGVAEVKE